MLLNNEYTAKRTPTRGGDVGFPFTLPLCAVSEFVRIRRTFQMPYNYNRMQLKSCQGGGVQGVDGERLGDHNGSEWKEAKKREREYDNYFTK